MTPTRHLHPPNPSAPVPNAFLTSPTPSTHYRSPSDGPTPTEPVSLRFHDWTGGRTISTFGTNNGAAPLPFQSWRPFKEAFAPELVERALTETPYTVRHIVDPFGGSGTTALAAQFLGVSPTTIEVNPFLADLIEAKVSPIDLNRTSDYLRSVLTSATAPQPPDDPSFDGAPKTFIEPGVDGRYLFSREIARRFLAYRHAIDQIPDPAHRRLFRVILGSIAIPVSNVVVSGKGRRYRAGWQDRNHPPEIVDELFHDTLLTALHDLRRFAARRCLDYRVLRGDARQLADKLGPHDLAVFSPPYPNSSDYTDVYNVELWTLGYLTNRQANARLRNATLRSHLQLIRTLDSQTFDSVTLRQTIHRLRHVRARLWSRHIPK